MDRRTCIKATVTGMTGLTLGAGLASGCGRRPRFKLEPWLWLNISPSDEITVIVVKNEMGQGVSTSLPMIVAEELEADWTKIKVQFEPEIHDRIMSVDANYGTADSMSMRTGFTPMRLVGAAAKEMLVAACAREWGVEAASLTASNGTVSHPIHGTLTYGALAAAASTLPVPKSPRLKDPAEFTLIGRPIKRLDAPAHLAGESTFGIDVTVPDMMYAAVLQSPVFGGEVSNFESLSLAGTKAEALVAIPNGVAVVARSWWDAKRALDSLAVEFTTPEGADEVSSESIRARLVADLRSPGRRVRSDGDAEAAMARAATRVDDTFEVPVLDHAALEPINCTAHVTADSCEVWVPTQWAARALSAAQRITRLDPATIKIHPTFIGGGFGRKYEGAFYSHPILASQAVGKPVKVIWSREEDMRHGAYRSAAMAELSGGLDAAGNIVSWRAKLAAPQGGAHPVSLSTACFRYLPYAIPNIEVRFVRFLPGIPYGYMRSVNMAHNLFFVESFVDELCDAASIDPLEFRLRHVRGNTRVTAVLERVAEMAAWGAPRAEGAAHGIALFDYTAADNTRTVVAHVAEVVIESSGKVRVPHIYCAVDCGMAINPDIVKAQIEGGAVFALTAAFYGEITLRGGAVEQSNYHEYRLLEFKDAPHVEVEIINTMPFPSGVGEYGVPGVFPAVTNAIYSLTGQRVRNFPLSKYDFRS
jgi:isoquinoline 1-oxidoreductase beta subunit